MPTFGPVKRDVLIRCLRKFGFDGPYSGGKHPFMVKGDLALTIPNPHHKDIGREFFSKNSTTSWSHQGRMGKALARHL
jgi:hypothetical protein